MFFQTVLSIVGMTFTAIELYQRFRQKDSSGSAQSPIYSITAEPRAELKHSRAPTSGAMTERSGEERRADERRADERSGEKRSGAPSRAARSAVSSKIGMV